MKSNLTSLCILIPLLLSLQGCITHKLKVNKVVELKPGFVYPIETPTTFKGIKALFEQNDTIAIFTTHGMGIRGFSYNEELIDDIVEGLKLSQQGASVVERRRSSALRRTVYGNDKNTLIVYNHSWSVATNPYTNILIGRDQLKDRLPGVERVKDEFLNINIADVVMYVGNFKEVIHQGIELSLERISENDKIDNVVVITDSLGSKVFFDVMNKALLRDSSYWSHDLVNKLTSFYMLANQLPLLVFTDPPASLFETPEEIVSEDEEIEITKANSDKLQFWSSNALDRLVQPVVEARFKNIENAGEKLEIVAFSDPNDILSYPFYKARDDSSYTVINVLLSIADTGYSLPFKNPQFVNPFKAHTGYYSDSRVVEYILEGKTLE